TSLSAPAPPADAAPISAAERKNRAAVERAEAGDWLTAVALLREARDLEPGNELYGKNLRAALTNAGFAEIAAGRFDTAVARFAEALRLGELAETRRGLGYAYYRLGNL